MVGVVAPFDLNPARQLLHAVCAAAAVPEPGPVPSEQASATALKAIKRSCHGAINTSLDGTAGLRSAPATPRHKS